jgi:TolB-like protein
MLIFEPGETVREIVVDIKAPGIYDDDKTFTLALQDPQGAVLGRVTGSRRTIVNTHPLPEAAFAASEQGLRRRSGNALVTLLLSEASSKDVTLPFTVSGTAIRGKDYQIITESPVTIMAGMTRGILIIALLDNAEDRDERTIIVTLGKPVNATPGKNTSHTITIRGADRPPRIAIMPLTNESGRKYAGEIMVSHLLRELIRGNYFTVVEPGLIKERMLEYRMIMYEGISLPDANLIARELDADLILTGRVLYYEERSGASGSPKVGFSLVLIDRRNQEVVWSSNSISEGYDPVFLFDWGRINTVSRLATEMARAVSAMIKK